MELIQFLHLLQQLVVGLVAIFRAMALILAVVAVEQNLQVAPLLAQVQQIKATAVVRPLEVLQQMKDVAGVAVLVVLAAPGSPVQVETVAMVCHHLLPVLQF
jgi:hypothetical protein